MKRLLPIFISLALVIAYGCEKDDDDENDMPVQQTNGPSNKADPEPTTPQYYFPAGLSIPLLQTTNLTVLTTTTINAPGEPYYQQTQVMEDNRGYSDGTTYSSNRTTIREETVASGITNTTILIEETQVIVFINGTTVSTELIEHSTDGIQDQYQFITFVEFNDGTIKALTKDLFDAIKTKLGI